MSHREPASSSDGLDDVFEPLLVDMGDDALDALEGFSSEKQRLAAKRRRAERRMEERRLREELGDYDLELDDF
jgi:hypothetical protein